MLQGADAVGKQLYPTRHDVQTQRTIFFHIHVLRRDVEKMLHL